MCISKFFVLLGFNSSFGKKCLGCRCDGRLGKRDFTNLCQEGKNVFLGIILYVYTRSQILGIFSQTPKTILNLMSYGKGYNVLHSKIDFFFFFFAFLLLLIM